MTEHDTPVPIENISVFKIPRARNLMATIALLAAAGNVSACAHPHEKQCEVVGTHTMQLGETVWRSVDNEIPEVDKDNSYDQRERMDWIKQVNPDIDVLGRVQAGDKINIPGNCK